MSNPDRAFDDFAAAFRAKVLPRLLSSDVTVIDFSRQERNDDIRRAAEIGFILMSGKPLVLVIQPGATAPAALRRAAAAVVENWNPRRVGSQEELARAIAAIPDAAEVAEDIHTQYLAELTTAERTCRVCGCTDRDCRQCVQKTGEPCHWVEPNLCSACVDIKESTE